nr:hypothetical protein [Dyella sp. ASV24]
MKRGERPTKKTAIAREELDAPLAACDDSLAGQCDRALLCFAFAGGGQRRSKVAAADLRDLHRLASDQYVYRLEHSKTLQAESTVASKSDKPILGIAAEAITVWLDASGVTEGSIFRRRWKTQIGGDLSPPAVGAIAQRRATKAGLKGNFEGPAALGLHHRGRPPRHRPARLNGDDRALCRVRHDRLFPNRRSRGEPYRLTTR